MTAIAIDREKQQLHRNTTFLADIDNLDHNDNDFQSNGEFQASSKEEEKRHGVAKWKTYSLFMTRYMYDVTWFAIGVYKCSWELPDTFNYWYKI